MNKLINICNHVLMDTITKRTINYTVFPPLKRFSLVFNAFSFLTTLLIFLLQGFNTMHLSL